MDDSHFRYELRPGHYICLSPLSNEVLEDLGVDDLGGPFGYFIYETEGGTSASRCTNILAKCPSFEAACRVMEIYGSPERLRPTQV